VFLRHAGYYIGVIYRALRDRLHLGTTTTLETDDDARNS